MTMAELEAWGSVLPKKVTRGPFEWGLCIDDGMAVRRDPAIDAVYAIYMGKGVIGEVRLNPWAHYDAGLPGLLAEVEREADKTYALFLQVHARLMRWESGQ